MYSILRHNQLRSSELHSCTTWHVCVTKRTKQIIFEWVSLHCCGWLLKSAFITVATGGITVRLLPSQWHQYRKGQMLWEHLAVARFAEVKVHWQLSLLSKASCRLLNLTSFKLMSEFVWLLWNADIYTIQMSWSQGHELNIKSKFACIGVT